MASNLHEKSEEDSSDWKEERKKYLEKIKKEDEEMIEKERVLRERLLAAYTEETGEEKFPDRDEKEYPLTVEAVRERIRREAAFRENKKVVTKQADSSKRNDGKTTV